MLIVKKKKSRQMKTFMKLMVLTGLMAIIACNNSSTKSEASGEEQEVPQNAGIVGEVVNYSTDSTKMQGFIAFDASSEEKRPGILVIHEWWGHNDYVRERAKMLAELGYVALALDMYGEGKQADHPDDAGKFAGMVMSNMPEAKARFEAAMEKLKSNPYVDGEKLAAIGYCFGGSVALSMANAGYDLDAVAAFHSGVELPVAPSEDIIAKVMVANGADDPFISAESVDAYKAAMDKVGADYEYYNYEGVVHSFTNPGADAFAEKFEMPVRYDEAADKDSWQKLKAMLDSVFQS